MNENAKKAGARWNYCAEGYNEIIQHEFSKELVPEWIKLLDEYAPCQGGRALDIGTGPGFFATLLARAGWQVDAIDAAENMVAVAKRNLENAGLTGRVQVMDNHELDFPDNTFDYIVCRNVTWILYDPEKAFAEWLRVLKPGGRLMYLDSNWIYHEEELDKARDKAEQEYRALYGDPPNTYTGDSKTNEEFNSTLYFSNIYRPDWDEDHLPKLGYVNIQVTPRVNERVYDESKSLLYRADPFFVVTADKKV